MVLACLLLPHGRVVATPVVRLVALLALFGVACGDESPPFFDARKCPHEVDGLFTGWPDCSEYAETLSGVYGDLHLDYDDGELYVLNDWFLRDDAPVNRNAYNLFLLGTADGTEFWDIRVYGDGRTKVLRNGVDFDGKVVGAHAFTKSPNHPFDHALFEFSVPCGPGVFSLNEKDPDVGTVPPDADITEDDAEAALVEEPTLATGVLTGEGAVIEEASGPVIALLTPSTGQAGDRVDIHGYLFGDDSDEVRFGSESAEIVTWSDRHIVAVVPSALEGESTSVRVVVDGERSNRVSFGCRADCGDMGCGDDGCGGTCECADTHDCVNAMCVCRPACDGKSCGDDACGGNCGECSDAALCFEGNCCTPECGGKECGDDACGGNCGGCGGAAVCVSGGCCTPECGDSNCGDDGCGGLCGECNAPSLCLDGTCCTPKCQPRDRGMPDGCGGTCML